MGLKRWYKDMKQSTQDLYKAGLTFNAKDIKDAGRTLITKAQEYDPGSVEFGISGVPGVKSQKDINERAEIDERMSYEKSTTQAAAAAKTAATEAANDELLDRTKRRKGYGSTLSGGQGLTGSSNVYRRTLLGA